MCNVRPDWDDLPHTFWHCKCCGEQNSSVDAGCQFCDVDDFSLQHEDDCTGYVVLHKRGPYEVRGTRIMFTKFGDIQPVMLEHEGNTKTFPNERAAFEALAKWKRTQDVAAYKASRK